jgi:hypothetical protein
MSVIEHEARVVEAEGLRAFRGITNVLAIAVALYLVAWAIWVLA